MSNHSGGVKRSERTKVIRNVIRLTFWLGGGVSGFYLALPSLTSCACTPSMFEAFNFLASINRAQRSYRIEKPTFAHSIAELEIEIPAETVYRYEVIEANDQVSIATATAPPGTGLKSYTGAAYMLENGYSEALLCRTIEASAIPPELEWQDGHPVCPPNSKKV